MSIVLATAPVPRVDRRMIAFLILFSNLFDHGIKPLLQLGVDVLEHRGVLSFWCARICAKSRLGISTN